MVIDCLCVKGFKAPEGEIKVSTSLIQSESNQTCFHKSTSPGLTVGGKVFATWKSVSPPLSIKYPFSALSAIHFL